MDRVLPSDINLVPSIPGGNEAPEAEEQTSSEKSTSFPSESEKLAIVLIYMML
jgi:hypothetical protein